LTITKAIEVIFSAAAAVLGSRSPAKTANALKHGSGSRENDFYGLRDGQ
jgi:hypothetical protein